MMRGAVPKNVKSVEEVGYKNVFYRVVSILGIFPPHSVLADSESVFTRFYRTYIIFLTCLMIFASAVSVIGRYYWIYPEFPGFTLVVTDLLLDVVSSVCNIITVLAPTFLYPKTLDDLMDSTQRICKKTVLEELFQITSSKTFMTQVFVSHVILLLLFTFDGYAWTEAVGLVKYSFFIYRKFQIYHAFMTVLVIYVYISFAKRQMKITNQHLRKKIESLSDEKIHNDSICTDIRDITQWYQYHVKQVGLFNKVFGSQIFFLTFSFVVGMINSINVIIFSGVSNTKVEFKTFLTLTYLFWTFWQLVIGGAAVVSCTETEEEGRKTGDICLGALVFMRNSEENAKAKEELILLNTLVNQHSPTFSAAGFFFINYGLLTSMVGSIMSYVIVLIQFDDKT